MTTNQRSQDYPFGNIALYNFGLCSLPQFAYMRMSVQGGCLTDPWANALTFSSLVQIMFTHCYDVDNKLQKDDLYFDKYPKFIYILMENYAARIQQSYQNDPRTGIRLMFDWLLKTKEIIEDNYRKFPTLYLASDLAAKKALKKCRSKDTWPVKLNVYALLYRFFYYRLDGLLPEMPDSLANLIPYNMWIGEYEKMRAEYTGKLGLEPSKRAIVYANDNKKFFYESLVDQCISFCNQMGAEQPSVSSEETFQHCEKEMTRLIHSCFQDYITRLQSNSKNEADIDAAIINWMVSLLTEIFESFTANQGKILDKCGRTPAINVAAMRFYLDICENNLLEIAHNYFLDSEKIPLVKMTVAKSSNMDESIPTSGVGHKFEQQKVLHTRVINHKTLYDAWNEKAFTGTSFKVFKSAIDTADFTIMLERAREAGQRSGYIGGVKYIIKRLAKYLGSEWYKDACFSIGVTINDLNKLNDSTKRISRIDTKVISKAIK